MLQCPHPPTLKQKVDTGGAPAVWTRLNGAIAASLAEHLQKGKAFTGVSMRGCAWAGGGAGGLTGRTAAAGVHGIGKTR
jgi:hypothetical protein